MLSVSLANHNIEFNILQLPAEVSMHVFAFLKPSEIFEEVKLTCRVWSQLTSDKTLWSIVARLVFEKPFLEKNEIEICKCSLGEKNYLKLLCKASAEGSKYAQSELFKLLKEITIDSCQLFEKLAQRENPWAQYCLAMLYKKYGPSHQKFALMLFKEAARKEVFPAQLVLAKLYLQSSSLIKNEQQQKKREKGKKLLLALAEKGYSEAQCYVLKHNMIFKLTKEKEQDYFENICNSTHCHTYYKLDCLWRIKNKAKAADLGHPVAAFELGISSIDQKKEMYYPDSLPYQLGKIYRKFELGILFQDNENAKEELKSYYDFIDFPMYYALMYLTGNVLPQDENQAFKWFKKTIALKLDRRFKNNCWFKKFLNFSFLIKQIEANPSFCKKIVNFYKRQAKQNKSFYQARLADLYENGKLGVKKNIERAIELYEKAAEKGDIDAIFQLLCIYYEKQDCNDKFSYFFTQFSEIAPQKKIENLLYKLKGLSQPSHQETLRLFNHPHRLWLNQIEKFLNSEKRNFDEIYWPVNRVKFQYTRFFDLRTPYRDVFYNA